MIFLSKLGMLAQYIRSAVQMLAMLGKLICQWFSNIPTAAQIKVSKIYSDIMRTFIMSSFDIMALISAILLLVTKYHRSFLIFVVTLIMQDDHATTIAITIIILTFSAAKLCFVYEKCECILD